MNIFKKPQQIFSEAVSEIINSKYIQKDLHLSFEQVLAEFDLKESKETQIENYKKQIEDFKEENKSIYDKIEKLNNLGFSSTPSAKNSLEELKAKEKSVSDKIKEIQSQIEKVTEIKNLTAEYSLKYPFYKFIDDQTMVNIMHKYNLVLGEAFMYSREIPDENLEIITYFEQEINESKVTKQLIKSSYMGMMNSYSFQDKPKPRTIDIERGIYIRDPSLHFYESVEKEFTISKLKMIAPESHFTIPTFDTRDYRREPVNIPIAKINAETRKFEFSTKELEKNEAKVREVLDPIACLEVEGGYIVMTAWDEEANIPEIKTNMLN